MDKILILLFLLAAQIYAIILRGSDFSMKTAFLAMNRLLGG